MAVTLTLPKLLIIAVHTSMLALMIPGPVTRVPLGERMFPSRNPLEVQNTLEEDLAVRSRVALNNEVQWIVINLQWRERS